MFQPPLHIEIIELQRKLSNVQPDKTVRASSGTESEVESSIRKRQRYCMHDIFLGTRKFCSVAYPWLTIIRMINLMINCLFWICLKNGGYHYIITTDLTFRRENRTNSTATRDVSIDADSSRKISILESLGKDKLIEEERAQEGSVINFVGQISTVLFYTIHTDQ